jgi:hypothetical protein
MPFPMTYYTNIFSRVMYPRSSNLSFDLVFLKMRCFNFFNNILCACNYYSKYLQISSWDLNGIGFCEAFYCEESLHLYWWSNFKQYVSFKLFRKGILLTLKWAYNELCISIRAEVMPLFLWQLVPKKTPLLTTLDVCCQKSSGHKAVKFGRNAFLNWDYNLTKNHSILRGSGWKCHFSVLIWCGMTL